MEESELNTHFGIALIHVLLSVESDVRGSWAELGVQTSWKIEVMDEDHRSSWAKSLGS